jgi:Protein kinase domain
VDSRFALPVDTVLDGAYRIERVVGSGGFGITYVAEDIKLGTTVALKEYYPFDFGDRDRTMSVRPRSDRHQKTFAWGRSNFLQEARTLARFEHSSIVRVTRVFEANSTAYMVMRFEEGQGFEAWLTGLGRPPTQEELDRIVTPLLEALQMMHAKSFLHRDIAPDNIIVRADGSPVLLDFGAARRAVAEMSRSLTRIIKAGYSPHEQYSSDGRLQGPWSDIYALGGALYRAVTGRIPDEATLRVDVDNMPPATQAAKGTYRPGFLSTIDACLKVNHAERPQSVAQLRPMLLGGTPPPRFEVGHSPQALAASRKPNTRRIASDWPLSPRWVAIAGAIAVVLGGTYGGYEYTRWQSAETGMHDAAPSHLAELIEVRGKEAKGAAQRQVEREAEQRREEAVETARRQAEVEAERRHQEAADAAAAEAARRQAELDAERQRREVEETARKQPEIEAERQRREAADVTGRQAELDAERRRKEETERIAAADDATRKAAAEAEAKRKNDERQRIASREEEAHRKAELEAKTAAGRDALTRSLQTELNRVGCRSGEIDGQWGTKVRAALAQFAKATKLSLATDEPSTAVLEVVRNQKGTVCPPECGKGETVQGGRCVKKLDANVTPPERRARPDPLAYSKSVWAPGSIPTNQTVSSRTPHGTLTCRGGWGGPNGTGRVCSWH